MLIEPLWTGPLAPRINSSIGGVLRWYLGIRHVVSRCTFRPATCFRSSALSPCCSSCPFPYSPKAAKDLSKGTDATSSDFCSSAREPSRRSEPAQDRQAQTDAGWAATSCSWKGSGWPTPHPIRFEVGLLAAPDRVTGRDRRVLIPSFILFLISLS